MFFFFIEIFITLNIFHYSYISHNIITIFIIWLSCYIISYHNNIIFNHNTFDHFIPLYLTLYCYYISSHYIILIVYTFISYHYFIPLFHIINFTSYILRNYIPFIIIIIITFFNQSSFINLWLYFYIFLHQFTVFNIIIILNYTINNYSIFRIS